MSYLQLDICFLAIHHFEKIPLWIEHNPEALSKKKFQRWSCEGGIVGHFLAACRSQLFQFQAKIDKKKDFEKIYRIYGSFAFEHRARFWLSHTVRCDPWHCCCDLSKFCILESCFAKNVAMVITMIIFNGSCIELSNGTSPNSLSHLGVEIMWFESLTMAVSLMSPYYCTKNVAMTTLISTLIELT